MMVSGLTGLHNLVLTAPIGAPLQGQSLTSAKSPAAASRSEDDVLTVRCPERRFILALGRQATQTAAFQVVHPDVREFNVGIANGQGNAVAVRRSLGIRMRRTAP